MGSQTTPPRHPLHMCWLPETACSCRHGPCPRPRGSNVTHSDFLPTRHVTGTRAMASHAEQFFVGHVRFRLLPMGHMLFAVGSRSPG